MRARWLKPEFFRDRKMAELGPVGAVVFQALWVSADDGGMAPCDPGRLKGEMFFGWAAVEEPEITGALRELHALGRVKFYQGGDELFCRIVNWRRHQFVHKPSKFRWSELYAKQGKRFAEVVPEWCGTSAAPVGEQGGTPPFLDSKTPRLLDSKTPKEPSPAPSAPAVDHDGGKPPEGAPHPAREWARPYYEPWVQRFGGEPNVGLLRKKMEPLERADGRDVTIGRWKHLVAGLTPKYLGKGDAFRDAVLRLVSAPAAYDDPEWHLSDRERDELARLTEGL